MLGNQLLVLSISSAMTNSMASPKWNRSTTSWHVTVKSLVVSNRLKMVPAEQGVSDTAGMLGPPHFGWQLLCFGVHAFCCDIQISPAEQDMDECCK